jgi:hypothetical protein
MGNVYRHDSQRLHELLEKASAPSGATMLIPDLQRPFVWTPNQVTLLIDSLIRGWPFGTLLLWKVNQGELQGIPFRPFWSVVDRTDSDEGAQVSQMNPPAQYHMVLDGQQRVQSLLLALGGDDWGFKLEDRDWTEEVKDQRPRGRRSKHPHWSKASLCFDLNSFLAEYEKVDKSLLAVDFKKVLVWAVLDPQDGQSDFPKPQNYEHPLPLASAPENRGRLIRLSRLWVAALPNAGLKEAQFRQIARPVLEQHEVCANLVEALLPPLGELLSTLRDVKLADVTFLELQPFDSAIWDVDEYNDAIVSIFTRLNTAGRTLEREEIILAWLKVGWMPTSTQGKPAGECFLELQQELGENQLSIGLDALVSAASFLWSVSENDGRLLANSDLLKGEITRPMASALSRRWGAVRHAFENGTNALMQRGLEYGPSGHFSSLYALAVLWGWVFVAEIWKSNHALPVLQKDDFEKRCQKSICKYIDRWILCSQWAGVWSGSSATTIEAYSRRLAELSKALETCHDLSQAHEAWDECFKSLVEGLIPRATDYVNSISAASRERVGIYRTILWLWHRLDDDRWAKSQVQLRVGRRKIALEVDHLVSFSLWADKLKTGLPTGVIDEDEAQSLANRLGNCALLEKNFNISKSDHTLKHFLSSIHEVVTGKVRIDEWCAALGIAKPLLDPDQANVDSIREAIDMRDQDIKEDVAKFIRGQSGRVDVDTPGVEATSTPEEIAVVENGEVESEEAALELAAVGTEILNGGGDIQREQSTHAHGQSAVVDLVELQTAYQNDSHLRLVIDHFASRENNQKVTAVDTLVGALNRAKTPLPRHIVVRVFRSLDALGIGRFIPGRKGNVTRFQWYEKSLRVGALAAGHQTDETQAEIEDPALT